MKKNLIVVITLTAFLISCENERVGIKISSNSFSYSQSIAFDDHLGESKTKIYDLNNNRTINLKIVLPYGQFKWIDSEVVYLQGSEILKFDPKTNQIRTIHEVIEKVQSFDITTNQSGLVYSDYEDIFLYDPQESSTINITNGLEGKFRFPKWSPDESSILVTHWVSTVIGDTAHTTTTNFKVYSLIDKSFEDIEMVDNIAVSNQRPTWSPNSEEILYEKGQGIYTFNLKTKQLVRITSNDVAARNPRFSRDGKMISYFSSDRSENGIIWQNNLAIFNLETESHKIINELSSFDVSWNLESNLLIFCAEDGIYSYNVETEMSKRLIEPYGSTFFHSTSWIN